MPRACALLYMGYSLCFHSIARQSFDNMHKLLGDQQRCRKVSKESRLNLFMALMVLLVLG